MGKQVKKHGYSCKLVRVVDGDTCDAMIDLGFDVWVKSRIRFYGVDTWESRTRNLEEKKKGLAAKAYVKDLLENSDEGKFSIISHGKGNTPEMDTCRNLDVTMLWGIGGGKIQSSSWLINGESNGS